MKTNITPKGRNFIIRHESNNKVTETTMYRDEFDDWQRMEERSRKHRIELERITIRN